MSITAFTDIANCELIVDSEDIFTDAGSTAAVNDGDIVQQANDTSGNARHWTNTGTSSTRPTCYNDPVLGKKVIEFTALSLQFLNLPNFLAGMSNGTTGATLLFVQRAKADPAVSGPRGGWLDFGGPPDSAWPYSDGNIYDGIGSTNNRLVYNPSTSLAQWIYYPRQAATNLMRSNTITGGTVWGDIWAENTSSAYGFSTTPRFGKSATGISWDGYLRLCVVYSRLLTLTEMSDANDLIMDVANGYMPASLATQVKQDKQLSTVYFDSGTADYGAGGLIHPIAETTRPGTSLVDTVDLGGQLYPRGDSTQ